MEKIGNMLVVVAFVVYLSLGVGTAQADTNSYCYGTVKVAGKSYYASLEDQNGSAALWFRVKPYQCNSGDMKMMVLTAKKQAIDPKKTVQEAAKALCKVKKVYDGGKTAVGCASTAYSALCLSASAPTGGTAAALCAPSLYYTVNKGAVDCVSGIADWIGSRLAGDKDWAVIRTQVGINQGQWADAIKYAIDAACGSQ